MKRRYSCRYCDGAITCDDTTGHWYIGRTPVQSERYEHDAPWCRRWSDPDTRALCLPTELGIRDSHVYGAQSASLLAVRRV